MALVIGVLHDVNRIFEVDELREFLVYNTLSANESTCLTVSALYSCPVCIIYIYIHIYIYIDLICCCWPLNASYNIVDSGRYVTASCCDKPRDAVVML